MTSPDQVFSITNELIRGTLVWWRHSCKHQTKEYNSPPVRRTAGKPVHQSCGTQSMTSPTSHSQDGLGLLQLLCWSHSWTQLVTKHPSTTLLSRLQCCSDERSLQDSMAGSQWQTRRSLGRSGPPCYIVPSGPPDQVQIRIQQEQ